jgi:hypothetical protein
MAVGDGAETVDRRDDRELALLGVLFVVDHASDLLAERIELGAARLRDEEVKLLVRAVASN